MLVQRDCIFDSGERFSFFADTDGVPEYWTTLFVTVNLRPRLTQNSIINVLKDLKHLMLWESTNSRNLIDEFRNKKFLDNDDIMSIHDHSTLKRSEVEKKNKISKSSDVIDMQIYHPFSVQPLETVQPHQQRQRLRNAADYLVFVGRTLHRKSHDRIALYREIDAMEEQIIKVAPRIQRSSGLQSDPDYRSAPPEVFDEVMKIVRVDSPDNPFRKNVRLRNQLMFDIMFETGLRGSEVLGLQIRDIDWSQQILKVVRRHDDVNDTRKRQPVAKTEEGEVFITKIIQTDLRKYIVKERARIAPARSHPYIFVNHRKGKTYGQPVSNQTFASRITKPKSKFAPEIFDEISRHGFRHNFNYRLSKRIDEYNKMAKQDRSKKPITQNEEIQIRKRVNRWRSDNSASQYNLRHIKEKSDQLMRAQLEEIDKILDKNEVKN